MNLHSFVSFITLSVVQTQEPAEPIAVCATLPSLGSIAQEVGGDQISITIFSKGTEDPHFVEARPSFVKSLSKAELFVQSGLELEIGWVPVLLQNARNGRVLPGTAGFVDASSVIDRLEVPTTTIDRSMGDVHPAGNPHYLTDPWNGIKVARLLRDKFSSLRPPWSKQFEERCSAFEKHICELLVGAELSSKLSTDGVGKLLVLAERGTLAEFLKTQGLPSKPGGFLGALLPYSGTKVVADHNLWPYLAHRYGIQVIGFLEPKPGIAPTTRHLSELIERIRIENVKLLLSARYFDPRHAAFVAEKSGVRVVRLAHEVGSLEGTESYLKLCEKNASLLLEALRAGS